MSPRDDFDAFTAGMKPTPSRLTRRRYEALQTDPHTYPSAAQERAMRSYEQAHPEVLKETFANGQAPAATSSTGAGKFRGGRYKYMTREQALAERVDEKRIDREATALLDGEADDFEEYTNRDLLGGPRRSRARFFERTDGEGLLYEGELHWLSGIPGAGKSWVAMAAIAHEIAAKRNTVLLDYENSDHWVVGRLLIVGSLDPQLGISEEDIAAHLLRPEQYVVRTQRQVEAWKRYLAEWEPSLIVVDAVNPCLTAHGWDENSSGDINRLVANVVTPARELGATALALDHVTKDPKGHAYPINSQAKLAQVTGVAYRLDAHEVWKRGQLNRADLTVTKDRHGEVNSVSNMGESAGIFELDSRQDAVTARVKPSGVVSDQQHSPQARAERLASVLKAHYERGGEAATQREVTRGEGPGRGVLSGDMQMRTEVVRRALEQGLLKVVPEGRRQILRPGR